MGSDIIRVVIELKSVGVTYPTGNVTALTDISLALPAGDFAFLVGPTGAGKSTLLKLLYADVRATAGTISVAGRDITKIIPREVPALRRQMRTPPSGLRKAWVEGRFPPSESAPPR